MLHFAVVILFSYYVEANHFTVTPFAPKTLLLLLVYHLVSINIITFIAYGVDKRAAQRGTWRVSERNLHTLEFLGGVLGALVGQKFFKHKTKKIEYQSAFWFIVFMEFVIVFVILRFLGMI
ncbi:MAG: DUF1294 domain-containing protein [Alphaproteobacteria bacterium]